MGLPNSETSYASYVTLRSKTLCGRVGWERPYEILLILLTVPTCICAVPATFSKITCAPPNSQKTASNQHCRPCALARRQQHHSVRICYIATLALIFYLVLFSFSFTTPRTTGQRDGLSQLDIEKINALYECRTKSRWCHASYRTH